MSIATKCTCGYSITGICNGRIKECQQLIPAGKALHPSESAGVKGAVWVKAEGPLPPRNHRQRIHINYKDTPHLLICYHGTWYWDDDKPSPEHPVDKDSWAAIEWLDEAASPAQSGKKDAVHEINRRNKIIEDNLKLSMRQNMPGVSEQEQDRTWQEFKKRNNL